MLGRHDETSNKKESDMRSYPPFIGVLGLCLGAMNCQAAVPADLTKQLDNALTPRGAELAGNATGSIPPYMPSRAIPQRYNPAHPGVRPTPFAAEHPLFSISAQNARQYADKLSESTLAMLEDETRQVSRAGISLSFALDEPQSFASDSYAVYDFLTRSYDLMGDGTGGTELCAQIPTHFFSPKAMAADGIR